MQGTIIENLSGRKLSVLVVLLIIGQIVCSLIGGLIAPTPANSQNILGSPCRDERRNASEPADGKWYYARGEGACALVDTDPFSTEQRYLAHELVYTFKMPSPRDNRDLDFSRWQQNLIGVLQIDVVYHDRFEIAPRTRITLDARLAYRSADDASDDWKPYAASVVERNLECGIENKRERYNYNCSMVPLFELGSLHHDFYLLNLRLPADTDGNVNRGLGHVTDLWLTVITQNGGFTKVWLGLKTVFFPIVLFVLVWYWRRVRMLSREPALLEYMLLALGTALSILNAPLEYLTLAYDMPFMLLLGDIRQGIFYATLLSFWLVFAGEHLMIQESGEQRRSLKSYWRHLSAVGVGCLSLFVFDMCERGVQLRNPFYSIWVTEIGTQLAVSFFSWWAYRGATLLSDVFLNSRAQLSFIILAGISAGLYLLFLTYMIWKVFTNISLKRAALPSMSSARRLHYEGIIYRFKFLMMTTLVCAALTIVGFILGQVAEGHWKWDEDTQLEITSAFFTGVYGMWNIYALALLCLYAPSHKQWPIEPSDHGASEEIEFSRLATEPNEMLSLTGLASKAALD